MHNTQDIANLIVIRNFLVSSIENLNMKLSREDIKGIQTRVSLLDKTIVEGALKLDFRDTFEGKRGISRSFSIESSEDTEAVIKKFVHPSDKSTSPISGTQPKLCDLQPEYKISTEIPKSQ